VRNRLILVGDDEALDVLAELSRHLDYFEVSRLDEPPSDRALDANDHLVVGMMDAARAARLLESALRHGKPGLYFVVPQAKTAGQRAILVAAQLVAVAAAPQ
jgi:hypothetical protein